MTDEENAEWRNDLKFDKYGQAVVPQTWSNIYSWPYRQKFAAACFVGSALLPVAVNYFMRRPIYSGVMGWSLGMGVITAVGYGSGYMYEQRHKQRDAIVEHYMKLHPYDFGVTKREFRQYKDILMPWEPIRAHERPIAWMEKSEWSKK